MIRTYRVNHKFFKEWSHDMAYVLGFWWADGWIYRNEFSISQKTSRKYILEKILSKMGSDYPIKTRKWGVCYFKVSSKDICQDIVRLGGKPHKSLDVGFPGVPKMFLPDFVRGYFDGDGCVCKMKDAMRSKRSGTDKFNYSVSFTSGSKIFIDALLEELRGNIIDFIGSIQTKREKNKIVNGVLWRHERDAYVLQCGINDARRLFGYMYNGGDLKLTEKFDCFDKIGAVVGKYLKRVFVPMETAQAIARPLYLKNCNAWRAYARKVPTLPLNPQKVYKKKWQGWSSFLGHIVQKGE